MERKDVGLERSGISYINMMAGTVLGYVITFYIFAWRFDIIEAWIYYGTYIIINILNLVLLYKYNLRLLNERGKKKDGIKKEDRIIMPFMLLFTYIFPSVFAGIELRTINSSHPKPIYIIIGILLLIISCILENWAMLVNDHYEKNIRIQNDRNHTVVTKGPYKYIRHPGYLSYILRMTAFPLILGSLLSIIPIVIGIIIYIIRTYIEDTVLKKELNGYNEYAKRTRYKLIPFIW